MKVFVPTYATTDGHELFIAHQNFQAPTREGAREVFAEFLFTAIGFGLAYTGIREIDTETCPHVQAKYGPYDVAIIAGPAFDRAAETVTAEGVSP